MELEQPLGNIISLFFFASSLFFSNSLQNEEERGCWLQRFPHSLCISHTSLINYLEIHLQYFLHLEIIAFIPPTQSPLGTRTSFFHSLTGHHTSSPYPSL